MGSRTSATPIIFMWVFNIVALCYLLYTLLPEFPKTTSGVVGFLSFLGTLAGMAFILAVVIQICSPKQ